MRLTGKLFALAVMAGAVSASAQTCNNKTIVDAYQLALSRQPTATECNANRYAGGDFQNTAQLVALVKASQVCSDPWIAQAFYKLGKQINGHDPATLEFINGTQQAGSTRDQCNYANYGSWGDFPTLIRNVQNYFSPTAAVRPPVQTLQPAAAQILTVTAGSGEAGTLMINQSAVITWGYVGSATCPAGVYVQLNGNNYSAAVPLTDRTVTIAPRFTNFAYQANTRVTLTIADACTGRVMSPTFSVLAVVKPVPGGKTISVAMLPVYINPAGPLLTLDGSIVDADRKIVSDPPHHYFLDSNRVLKVSDLLADAVGNVVAQGGGNVVAQGGGNVVAQGGGNVVAQGGGNVVAAGGGNLVAGAGNLVSTNGGNVIALGNFTLQQAPGRVAVAYSKDGYLLDAWGERILHAGSGVRIRNSVLSNASGAPLIGEAGSSVVIDSAGAAKIIVIDQGHLQQLAAGQINLASVLTPTTTANVVAMPNIQAGQLRPGAGSPGALATGGINPNANGSGLLSPGNTNPTLISPANGGNAVLLSPGNTNPTLLPSGAAGVHLPDKDPWAIQSLKSAPSSIRFVINSPNVQWMAGNTLRASWKYTGQATATQAVIVQLRAENGKTYPVCTTSVTSGRCQSAPNFSAAIPSRTKGILVLLDGASHGLLPLPTVIVTIP